MIFVFPEFWLKSYMNPKTKILYPLTDLITLKHSPMGLSVTVFIVLVVTYTPLLSFDTNSLRVCVNVC
jgi:hypothetical protein